MLNHYKDTLLQSIRVICTVILSLYVSAALSQTNELRESEEGVSLSFNEYAFLEEVTNSFILPKHKEFEKSVKILGQQVERFCADKSEVTWMELGHSWSSAMSRWMELHLVNFGPIDDSNLAWRFQFWPDPMNLVARKLKSRVKGRNKKITSEQMAKASVAIQGLSALEYLLFDHQLLGMNESYQSYKEHPHLCRLLQSTVNNLLSNAARLRGDWYGGYLLRWLSKEVQAENPKYFKYNIEKVFSGMTMVVGMSYRDRIGKPLGIKKDGQSEHSGRLLNPYLLESWRSGHSLENIKRALISVDHLYRLKGSFSDILLNLKTDEASYLDRQIKRQLDHVLSLLSDSKTSAYDAINGGNTEVLFEIYDILKELHTNLKVRYSQLIGIQFRFNAHDGD